MAQLLLYALQASDSEPWDSCLPKLSPRTSEQRDSCLPKLSPRTSEPRNLCLPKLSPRTSEPRDSCLVIFLPYWYKIYWYRNKNTPPRDRGCGTRKHTPKRAPVSRARQIYLQRLWCPSCPSMALKTIPCAVVRYR